MDSLSDFDNMDIVLGDGNSNPFERELTNTIKGSFGLNDTETFSNDIGNSSQDNEIRDYNM